MATLSLLRALKAPECRFWFIDCCLFIKMCCLHSLRLPRGKLMSRVTTKIGKWQMVSGLRGSKWPVRQNDSLDGPPLEPPNRDSAKQLLIVLPAAHLNMTLPLPQNLTILGTSPHRVPSRWKFVYSDKALHHYKQGNPALKTRGLFKSPITHPTHSGVSSSTVFRIGENG